MHSAARIICRLPSTSLLEVVLLRKLDSRAYAAIVSTADLKSLIFNVSGAVVCKIGRSHTMADQAAANLWRITTLEESVGRPR